MAKSRSELPHLYYPKANTVRVINAHRGGSSNGYLLDAYSGSVGAYSLQQLSAANLDVVRVRRSSDSAELDFNAAEVTDGTLTAWTGANDGFAAKWYDQSGNANHLLSAADSNQPKIVSAGALVAGGLDFDGSDDYLSVGSGIIGDDFGVFAVASSDNANGAGGVWESKYAPNANYRVVGYLDTRATPQRHSNFAADSTSRLIDLSSQLSASTKYLHTTIADSNDMTGYIDGVLVNSVSIVTAATGNDFVVGRQEAGLLYLDGQIAELIVYAADKSSDRSGIEANINNRQGVY
jgi:hypothetical protein